MKLEYYRSRAKLDFELNLFQSKLTTLYLLYYQRNSEMKGRIYIKILSLPWKYPNRPLRLDFPFHKIIEIFLSAENEDLIRIVCK